eukprot:7590187-Pyramimonas_sp.AAC.1
MSKCDGAGTRFVRVAAERCGPGPIAPTRYPSLGKGKSCVTLQRRCVALQRESRSSQKHSLSRVAFGTPLSSQAVGSEEALAELLEAVEGWEARGAHGERRHTQEASEVDEASTTAEPPLWHTQPTRAVGASEASEASERGRREEDDPTEAPRGGEDDGHLAEAVSAEVASAEALWEWEGWQTGIGMDPAEEARRATEAGQVQVRPGEADSGEAERAAMSPGNPAERAA